MRHTKISRSNIKVFLSKYILHCLVYVVLGVSENWKSLHDLWYESKCLFEHFKNDSISLCYIEKIYIPFKQFEVLQAIFPWFFSSCSRGEMWHQLFVCDVIWTKLGMHSLNVCGIIPSQRTDLVLWYSAPRKATLYILSVASNL